LQRLTAIDNLIIDMDGVLYRGAEPLPGLADFFAFLRQRPVRFVLATNNATLTARRFADKLGGMGVKVSPAEILTSGWATALYIKKRVPPGTAVHVVGEEGLIESIRQAGLLPTRGKADWVAAGLDRRLTYAKLREATKLIRAGAVFIGTNPDVTYPAENYIVPGAGTVLAALQAATGQEPIIIGKPEPEMLYTALEQMGADTRRAAVVGDRLETDILSGQRVGLLTILVLSGVTSHEMLAASAIQPDLVFQGIRELLAAWRAADAAR
jgi:4-nitrophenyl phosphatase